jgi:hypothetical protein
MSGQALSLAKNQPVSGQVLSITGYQLVSQQATSGGLYLTYSAQLVNSGPALGSVTATLNSGNPFSFRVLGQADTLNFSPVPANSQVASSNTFMVLTTSTSLDLTQVEWTFQTTPAGPIANAGPNQTANVGSTVTLNGSASTTPSGTLTYSWKFFSRPAGTSSILINWTTVMPSFVVDVPGTYVVTLTVNNGTQTSSANVTISTTETAPVAQAGANQTVAVGATALLNGSGSSDVDGNPLTFSWTMMSRPTGSNATLQGGTTVTPSFTVDKPGSYTIQLVVNDGFLNSAPSQVTISTLYTAPVANAGTGQVVTVGSSVQLDGSGSSDSDGNALAYQWSLITVPSGSGAMLSNAAVAKPTFTADLSTTYVAQLIVNDGITNSTPATVTITTTSLLAPTANPGNNQTVSAGTVVSLNGGGTDPQLLPLNYNWSLTTLPPNSKAKLSSATIANPTFTADLPGAYIAQLIVNNGTLSSSPATVTVTASAPAGIQMPVNIVVAPGQSVPLNVTLGSAAPAGGLFVSLASNNPSAATVAAAFIIPGGATAPAIMPKVKGMAFGSATITATAFGFPQATGTVQVTETLSFSPASLTITGTTTSQLFLFIPEGAPAGGVTLNLSSSTPGVATVPATAFIGPGATNTNIPVTGVSGGSTVIHASGANIADTTANVIVNAPVIGGPSIAVVSGSPQSATINTVFAAPMVVVVKDSSSNPVSGATVTFTAPGSGASGAFAGGVNTAITNASGIATSVAFSANGTFGNYTVTASAGVAVPASFSLTNLASTRPSITPIGGTPQTTAINTAFGNPLVVVVKDGGGNPESGITVTFAAPASGASGTFAGGVNTATTNASGVATSQVFTANGTAGPYTVTASAPGISPGATFSLTNTTPISLNPTAMAITDGVTIGEGLQVQGVVTLGSPAPAGGLTVQIISNNLEDPGLPNGGPRAIQVASTATGIGADATSITIPAGASIGTFYIQGVGNAGLVTYTVQAPGFTSQSATVYLAESGFVVATPQGFGQPTSVSLSAYQQNPVTTPISVYAALLSGLNAFVVNQQVAGGSSMTLSLTNSNSAAGSVAGSVTISGGSDHTDVQFTPQGLGSTVISVNRRAGNPLASTDGSVTVTVTP